MPKKGATKKTRAKKNKPVAEMPSLIFSESKITETPSHTPNTETQPDQSAEEKFFAHYQKYNLNSASHRWMWAGVIIFALSIATLWGVAIHYRITSVRWGDTAKSGIVASAQNSWNQIFTETQKKENFKKQVTQLLAELAIANSASTTAVVATPTSTTWTTSSTIISTTTSTTP
ncbi:MAG: hypothetical protein WCT40_04605 [Candidatus Magasanikbacteria bacterium]|jgi:hypothetical protein